MELASSSVRTPLQYLRASDCVATHGGVASSSSSSYGVFLSGRKKNEDSAQGKASLARVVLRDQPVRGVAGLHRSFELERPDGAKSRGRRHRCSKLGQVLAEESCTQLGDTAGPSGRTLRIDASSCYTYVSMSMALVNGVVSGNKNHSKFCLEKSVRKSGLSTDFLQLGLGVTSTGYRSKSNVLLQKKAFRGRSCGWILSPAAGLIEWPLTSKRDSSYYWIISTLYGNMSQAKARGDIRTAAIPSDYKMTYPDVPTDAIASSSYLIQEGDTLTSIAKKFGTSVPVLADVNKIEDLDLLLTGQPLRIPKAYVRVPGPGVDIDEFPVPTGYELRAPHERIVHNQVGHKNASSRRASTIANAPVQESRSQVWAASVMPAVGPNFAKFAVPVLLIAPLLGFCIRCIVDALYIHMDREEARQQSQREADVDIHRPKAQRWQRILEEDRDADEGEGPNLMKEWPKDNIWSSELTGPTENIWNSEVTGLMDADAREKTREILSMDKEEEVVIRDEKDDYEDIRKSYAELESSYMKFLVDSGLSKSGYWRGGVPTTTAHNGEPQ